MFFSKAILIFGSIAVCFVSLTKSDSSEEETKIKTIDEVMKTFLRDVHEKVDKNLRVPDSFHKFKKVHHRYHHITNMRSIRNKEDHFEDFLKEYQKVVDCTKEVVREYHEEISNMVNNRYNVGTPEKRRDFCAHYTQKYFDEKLELTGYETNTERIKNLENDLKSIAKGLVDRIAGLVDLPPPPPVPVQMPSNAAYPSNGNKHGRRSHGLFGGTNIFIIDTGDSDGGGGDGGGLDFGDISFF